ncbi:MAG: nucleotidyltransferase family protein [Acidobacteria bacterium]|nr:nucleotidyltransferase family protein [Acidobacteriota bacterium]
MPGLQIELDNATVRAFCERNGIRKLSLFGSVLTPRFHPESDLDVLVEFQRDRTPTLFDLAGMEEELSGLVGRRVDLRTPEDLSRYFRAEVIKQAVVQYERA